VIARWWLFYADAVYGSGDDLQTGIKQNEGFKGFTDHCDVWSKLSKKDAAAKNNLIFMAVDKLDRPTTAAICIQSCYRGKCVRQRGKELSSTSLVKRPSRVDESVAAEMGQRSEDATRAALVMMEDAKNAFKTKADRQLNRIEFCAALIKTAIERFVRSKDNPKNELNDVSDAFDALITNLVEPTLFMPLSGHAQPKMPLADDFRTDVCYTAAMDAALMRNAPALRVIFTGLAKIAFEESRSGGGVTPLPKMGSAQQVKREGAKWILVPGHVSITLWRKFTDNIGLLGLDNREQTFCFVWAIMVVIDGYSTAGGVKERHLPFEGFLEALVRLATVVPLPTDEQLAACNKASAGAFLANIVYDDPTFDAMCAVQKTEWGGVPDPSRGGEMPRRVEHLVDVMVRTIKGKGAEAGDEPTGGLTRRQFRMWALQQLGATEAQLPDAWTQVKAVGE